MIFIQEFVGATGLEEGLARRGLLPDNYIRSVDSNSGYPDLAPITNGFIPFSSINSTGISAGDISGMGYPVYHQSGSMYPASVQDPGNILPLYLDLCS